MNRILKETQLELNKTYEQQRNCVNKVIIPTVMDTLDQDTFPIIEDVVYKLLHKLHRHQREDYLMKKKSESVQDSNKRRKHKNGRRNEVSSLYKLYLLLK